MDGAAMPAAVVADAAAAAAAYLRMGGTDEVTARAAASACALAEAFCGQRLFRRDAEDVIDGGGGGWGGESGGWRRLAQMPVSGIGGVTGLPADAGVTGLPADAGLTGLPAEGAPFALPMASYAIDIDADGVGWVRVTAPGAAARVAVSYTAGLAAGWADLPEPLAQGVVLLAAHLVEHREGGAAPPAAVAALWRPYRRMRLCGSGRR